MGKKKATKTGKNQKDMFNIQEQLNTAACVPQIREAIKAWRTDKYKGITATTRELFNFWFHTDHVLPDGQTFRYHSAQREAIGWDAVKQYIFKEELHMAPAPP